VKADCCDIDEEKLVWVLEKGRKKAGNLMGGK
jgi:hypothetical protein